VEAFPLKNIKAKTVAEVFVSQIVSRHRVPLEIHTGQGRNFESKLFTELMEILGIKKTRTTALHSQSEPSETAAPDPHQLPSEIYFYGSEELESLGFHVFFIL